MKLTTSALIGLLISVIRNYVNDDVVLVIKRAIGEWTEAAEDGWQPQERTNFVIDKAREVADATPNVWDDLIVEILAKLYIAYFVIKGRAAETGAQS